MGANNLVSSGDVFILLVSRQILMIVIEKGNIDVGR